MDLLGVNFDFSIVPPLWKLCFNEKCPLAKQCLRYAVGEKSPKTKTWGSSVFPAAWQENERCPHFKEIRIIRAAYGFKPLFRNVKVKDAPVLRRKMKSYLGSQSYYYRYNSGEYLLTPDQQKWILDLFRSYGYDEGLDFVGYRELLDFS